MKITKYKHACWEIRDEQARVLIDPGIFSASMKDYDNIKAIVVTHIHSDHFDPDKLSKITAANPQVQVFAPSQVAKGFTQNVTVPKLGESYNISNFLLVFSGGRHHLFDDTENIAVTVNDKFFSPGDSYTKPTESVAVAAVPAAAPWLRIDEAIENIKLINAATVVPTHNALLSEIGESIHYRILSSAAEQAGKIWKVVKVGESIEV